MKVLLDACMAANVYNALLAEGIDVEWTGNWQYTTHPHRLKLRARVTPFPARASEARVNVCTRAPHIPAALHPALTDI
jgi:hypothetical protein